MSTEETLSREAIEEFRSLWQASGWKSHAEAGRKLELSRSVIGKFLSGETRPSAGTLKLFKLILLQEKPEALTAASLHGSEHLKLSEWERRLFAELRGLNSEDRERVLNAVKAFVAGLPKKEPLHHHRKSDVVTHHRAISSGPEETDKADSPGNPGNPVERASRRLMNAVKPHPHK